MLVGFESLVSLLDKFVGSLAVAQIGNDLLMNTCLEESDGHVEDEIEEHGCSNVPQLVRRLALKACQCTVHDLVNLAKRSLYLFLSLLSGHLVVEYFEEVADSLLELEHVLHRFGIQLHGCCDFRASRCCKLVD